MKTKFIFITGGICSSLGKGISSSSLGFLMQARGFKIFHKKFDPYLNVDPGTLNPKAHGECFVTDDGTEADLDLGHYERFSDVNTNRFSNYTSGKIYQSVLNKERRGEYLGETVQIIPHITNKIKESISAYPEDTDIVICEIGGTVGDIESLPFLEALRQFKYENNGNCLFIHVTLVPYLTKAGEFKSKPTQHSVGKLREIGIIPDILVCRSERELPSELLEKTALFCNVKKHLIFQALDVDDIYEVPLRFKSQNLDAEITKILNLPSCDSEKYETKVFQLEEYVNTSLLLKNLNKTKMAIIGKYTEVPDAYKSLIEALKHSGVYNESNLDIEVISSEDFEDYHELPNSLKKLNKYAGIIIPGGFGNRGIEGKINVSEYARENKIPCLGICLGMQVMAVEYARNKLNLHYANSEEFDPKCEDPVIHLMDDQKDIKEKGGTMRLGSYPCETNRILEEIYKYKFITERHRHRYEFNNEYIEAFENNGMNIVGASSDDELVEAISLEGHPWYIGVQFHPELKSRPLNPHPLFNAFIKVAKERLD